MRRSLLLLVLVGCARAAATGDTPATLDVKPVASARPIEVSGSDAGDGRRRAIPAFEAADRLVAEARALSARGEYAPALERFEAAFRMAPNDDVLYEVGRTLELLGRNREAAETYEKLLQGDLSPTDRMSMELRIRQLRGPRTP